MCAQLALAFNLICLRKRQPDHYHLVAVCQMIMRCHCASRRCENNSRWLVIVVGIAMSTSNEANIGCHASFQRVQVSMHKISFQLVLRVRTATHRRRRCRRRRRLIGNARDVVALAVSCTHVLCMLPGAPPLPGAPLCRLRRAARGRGSAHSCFGALFGACTYANSRQHNPVISGCERRRQRSTCAGMPNASAAFS